MVFTAKHAGASLLDSSEVTRQFSDLDSNLPIFLSTLNCHSSDMQIIDCDRNDRLGLTECSHDQDVYVHCEGKFIILELI